MGTTVVVAVVVDGFFVGKFWFFAPPPYAGIAGIGPDVTSTTREIINMIIPLPYATNITK